MKKQLNITIDEDLFEKVKIDAKKEGRTISNYIQKAVFDQLELKTDKVFTVIAVNTPEIRPKTTL